MATWTDGLYEDAEVVIRERVASDLENGAELRLRVDEDATAYNLMNGPADLTLEEVAEGRFSANQLFDALVLCGS